jgi:RNA polymerase sigma-70 factor (ECF subfamily)
MSEDRLTELYRTYGPAIYHRCLRLLRDRAAAEDATQETFVRVHRHLDKAPEAASALAWVYRIATNYCLNEIRDRKLRPEPHDELPEGTAGASTEAALADRDLAERVIRRSPESVRVVAWLHYVDGIDQGEVARVLGLSRRTVASRVAEFRRLALETAGRAA